MTRTEKLKLCMMTGTQKGWSGFVWILKILVPISLFTALVEYSGILNRLDFLLEPMMGFIGLPTNASLPIIIGILTGIYGAVASMAMLPLSINEMTLIAIFLLISHGLVQECIIQGKSGFHAIKAAVFRLSMSVVVVYALSFYFKTDPASSMALSGEPLNQLAFWAMIRQWAVEMLVLSLKILGIITVLMIILEIMKQFNHIRHIVNFLSPVLKVMGLNSNVGVLWLTASLFGIAYGGAVIMEEVKNGNLSKDDLTRLHLSIGVNHAMIEDPALFLPLGIPALWLWIPRLISAIVIVHLYNIVHFIRAKHPYGFSFSNRNA